MPWILFGLVGVIVWIIGAVLTFGVVQDKTGEVGLLALATCVVGWPIYLPLVYFFAESLR